MAAPYREAYRFGVTRWTLQYAAVSQMPEFHIGLYRAATGELVLTRAQGDLAERDAILRQIAVRRAQHDFPSCEHAGSR